MARVASLYRQRVQATAIVGSSLTFVTGGRIVHQALEGYQDRETKRRLAFLIGGTGAPRGPEAIPKRASVDEMFTPRIRASGGEGGSGDDVQAGLSCFIERHGGVELVGHSGDQNGFISYLYIHRPSASGYIVSFNTDVSSKRDARHSTRAVDDDLRDVIIRELFQPVGRR